MGLDKKLRFEPPKGSCACDLCGNSSDKKIRRTADYLYLCSDCCDRKGIMVEGFVRESAVRFMMGNVI